MKWKINLGWAIFIPLLIWFICKGWVSLPVILLIVVSTIDIPLNINQ